jgi:hypothetical protein
VARIEGFYAGDDYDGAADVKFTFMKDGARDEYRGPVVIGEWCSANGSGIGATAGGSLRKWARRRLLRSTSAAPRLSRGVRRSRGVDLSNPLTSDTPV